MYAEFSLHVFFLTLWGVWYLHVITIVQSIPHKAQVVYMSLSKYFPHVTSKPETRNSERKKISNFDVGKRKVKTPNYVKTLNNQNWNS